MKINVELGVITDDTISLEEISVIRKLLEVEWICSRSEGEEDDGNEFTISYEEGMKMLALHKKLDRMTEKFDRYHIKDGIRLVR